MTDDFWLQVWRDGHLGFHQAAGSATLRKYWSAIGAPAGARVFVPLAGKSRDMLWLAQQGYGVRGVELSPLAIQQFFAENKLQSQCVMEQGVPAWNSGPVQMLHASVFELPAGVIADCTAFYDRAAIVALSPDQRAAYAAEVYGRLPLGCRGLMTAFDYPQEQMSGPPFSVPEAEIRTAFEPLWDIQILERRDLLPEEPHFAARGLSTLTQITYRLERVR